MRSFRLPRIDILSTYRSLSINHRSMLPASPEHRHAQKSYRLSTKECRRHPPHSIGIILLLLICTDAAQSDIDSETESSTSNRSFDSSLPPQLEPTPQHCQDRAPAPHLLFPSPFTHLVIRRDRSFRHSGNWQAAADIDIVVTPEHGNKARIAMLQPPLSGCKLFLRFSQQGFCHRFPWMTCHAMVVTALLR